MRVYSSVRDYIKYTYHSYPHLYVVSSNKVYTHPRHRAMYTPPEILYVRQWYVLPCATHAACVVCLDDSAGAPTTEAMAFCGEALPKYTLTLEAFLEHFATVLVSFLGDHKLLRSFALLNKLSLHYSWQHFAQGLLPYLISTPAEDPEPTLSPWTHQTCHSPVHAMYACRVPRDFVASRRGQEIHNGRGFVASPRGRHMYV